MTLSHGQSCFIQETKVDIHYKNHLTTVKDENLKSIPKTVEKITHLIEKDH